MLNNLIKKIKYLFILFLDWLSPNRHKPAGILAEVQEALHDWKYAKKVLDYADNEMIDYAIHNINATEKRYVGLLQKARETGIKAWDLDTGTRNKTA